MECFALKQQEHAEMRRTQLRVDELFLSNTTIKLHGISKQMNLLEVVEIEATHLRVAIHVEAADVLRVRTFFRS